MTTVYTVAASTIAGSSGLTVSFAVTGSTATGDSVVLGYGGSTPLVPASITDTQSNVYTLAQDFTSNPVSGIYYCLAPAPLTTSDHIVVTYASSPGTSCDVNLVARGITGGKIGFASGSTPAFKNGSSAAPSTNATGTLPSNANGYYLGVVLANGNGGGTPTSPTSGYTTVATEHGGAFQYLTYYDQVHASGTSLTFGATITSAVWSAGIAAFGLPLAVAPPVATVTIGTPLPTITPGTGPPAATVTIGTPAPTPVVFVLPPAATVTIGTPAPGVLAGKSVLPPAATITIATPLPSVQSGAGAAVATITIAAPAPGLSRPVLPPAATVALSTPLPVVRAGTGPPSATVAIGAPAPSAPHTGVLAASATVTVAALAPGVSPTIPAACATVVVGAPVPGFTLGGFNVLPPAAAVSVAALAPTTSTFSGILAVSIASEPGIDDYGNQFPAGLAAFANANASNTISVVDGQGDTLATMDSQGDITGQLITANTDVILAGTSLTQTLNDLSEGVISRGYIPFGDLPFPSTPVGGSEIGLYEQDFALTGGRFYEISLDNCEVTYSATSGSTCSIKVRATLDGTTPTTSSDIFMHYKMPVSAQLTEMIPTVKRNFGPGSNVTMRCLVTLVMDTGSGTVQASDMTFGSVNFGGGQWQLSCYDMADSVGPTNTLVSGGSAPTPPQTYTTTWHPTATYSYQGSDGTDPNLLHDTNGQMLQGGSASATFNGRAKTWMLFNYSSISAALSGATINWVTLTLANQHTWYSGGMTVALGWSADTTFGSTKPNPGANYDLQEWHQNSGAKLTTTLKSLFGTAFQSGGATSLVLFVNSNDLTYYGYFAGGSNPSLTINYTVS